MEDHVYMPKHFKLDEKEIKELLEQYNITKKQLPIIKKKDSSLANLDVNPGDIIKIIRDSPTVGKSTFYRLVT